MTSSSYSPAPGVRLRTDKAGGVHTPVVSAAGATGESADAAVLAITAGGTSQVLFAANAARRFVLVQNLSAGDLWIDFGADAVVGPPAIKIAPGYQFDMQPPGFIDTQAINIIGATTGQEFAAKEA